jgi:hypothetical protein
LEFIAAADPVPSEKFLTDSQSPPSGWYRSQGSPAPLCRHQHHKRTIARWFPPRQLRYGPPGRRQVSFSAALCWVLMQCLNGLSIFSMHLRVGDWAEVISTQRLKPASGLSRFMASTPTRRGYPLSTSPPALSPHGQYPGRPGHTVSPLFRSPSSFLLPLPAILSTLAASSPLQLLLPGLEAVWDKWVQQRFQISSLGFSLRVTAVLVNKHQCAQDCFHVRTVFPTAG